MNFDSLPPDIPLKKCANPECKNPWLPATTAFFYNNQGRLYTSCKECVKAQRRAQKGRNAEYMRQYRQTEKNKAYRKQHSEQYYQEHREERLERDKHYHEMHKAERNEQKRQRRKSHPDLVHEQERRSREKHKEQRAARKKRWQQSEVYKRYQKRYQKLYVQTEKGMLQVRATRHKRRAQKRATGHHTAQQIQEQLKRQKNKCHWCHKKLDKYHIDHVIPLSRGGSNDISNIVIACPTCNRQKHTKLPHEWDGSGGRLL